MALAPDTRLGPYEIIAPLGAGGMGEVYRARDTRLDRTVAIKLLPEAFADDPERLARFEREARLLASLSHPNIAVLHGLESDAGRRFIAMEYVQGDSLAERLRAGALPVDDALDVARQVATALEAAHDGGVVHRDLKPGNVMVTPAGLVKVLDFGLAKGPSGSPSDSSLSMSPTRTQAMTGEGVILGTAAYMSPEQARGKPVDRRTDIWAFGCVLYECLTGRQAFEGETVSDLIASILKGGIEWSALPADTPPRVRELLHRCLERDARQRLRDIGEARLVLEQPNTGAAPAAAPAPAPARPAAPLPWLAAGALLLAALAAAGAWALKPAPKLPATWAELTPPATLRWDANPAGSGAVSADGRWYASAALDSAGVRRLLVRDLETGGARLLAGTEEGSYPFWSPDAKSLGFFVPGRLQRIDLDGGAITTIAPSPDGRGGTWSREQRIVFAPSPNGGLSAVSASGGDVRVLVPDSLRQGYRFPQFLPDGRRFTVGRFESGGRVIGELHSLDGGKPVTLPLSESAMANMYFAHGHLYYCEDFVLRARPFDMARGRFTGDAVTVAAPVAMFPPRGRANFSVGEDGTIVYRAERSQSLDQVVVRDRAGAVLKRLPARGMLEDLDASPDGARVATSLRADRRGSVDVWTYDLERGSETRLSFSESNDDAVWSADGAQMAWAGPGGIFTRASSGAGEPVLVFATTKDISPSQWLADGKTLLFTGEGEQMPGKLDAVWALDLAGGQAREIINSPAGLVRHGQVSPDGRWIAYAAQQGSRYEVFIMDYPGLKGRWQVSARGGVAPRWRSDGRELYFIDFDDQVVAASVTPGANSLSLGTPAVLFEHEMGSHWRNRNFSWDVDADGRRYFMLAPQEPAEQRPAMTLARGWVPAKAGK